MSKERVSNQPMNFTEKNEKDEFCVIFFVLDNLVKIYFVFTLLERETRHEDYFTI
jgi:hypothetical protein